MKTIQEMIVECGLFETIKNYQTTKQEINSLLKIFIENKEEFKRQKGIRFILLYNDTLMDIGKIRAINQNLERLLNCVQNIDKTEQNVSYGKVKVLANAFKKQQNHQKNSYVKLKNNFAVLIKMIKNKNSDNDNTR